MLKSFLIMLYEYGIFPALLGFLWIRRGEKASFTKIYLRGYITMLTLFWIVAVPMIRMGKSLTELTLVWNTVSVIAIPVVILWAVIKKRRVRRIMKDLCANIKVARTSLGILMAVCVVATLLSMVIVMPSKEDDTTEHVAIAVDTNEMYRYAVYTKIPHEMPLENKEMSPIDMFYAVGVVNTGMKATMMIHLLLPLFLLPLFYAVSWQTARYIYKQQLEKISIFVVILIITLSVSCYTKSSLIIGTFQNIWNATTLYVSCGFPMVLIHVFSLLDALESRDKIRRRDILLLGMQIVVSELMLAKGAFLSVLIIASCGIIYLIRRSMCYGKCIDKHKR